MPRPHHPRPIQLLGICWPSPLKMVEGSACHMGATYEKWGCYHPQFRHHFVVKCALCKQYISTCFFKCISEVEDAGGSFKNTSRNIWRGYCNESHISEPLYIYVCYANTPKSDQGELFPYYYVPAAPLGPASPARVLAWAPLQGPPPLPPPVKNPPTGFVAARVAHFGRPYDGLGCGAPASAGGLDRHFCGCLPIRCAWAPIKGRSGS